MPFNSTGLNNPFGVNTLSLHSANPGLGADPTPGTELTDAPYARQSVTLGAPTAGVVTTAANVTFGISTASNQNVQFVGLWEGSVYKGYIVPAIPRNFTEPATTREFTVSAGSTISITNPA